MGLGANMAGGVAEGVAGSAHLESLEALVVAETAETAEAKRGRSEETVTAPDEKMPWRAARWAGCGCPGARR